MLKIEMEDLFAGFIRNYYTFGIRDDSNWTKWTHRILGFYAELGRMLGTYVEYEWHSFDLVWFWDDEDRKEGYPWLHVEHENSPKRLGNLLEKIDSSKSYNIIAIGYPPSYKEERAFVSKVEDLKREWSDLEVLVIMDTEDYEEDETSSLRGYICKYGRKTKVLEAKKGFSKDGNLYAYLPKKS